MLIIENGEVIAGTPGDSTLSICFGTMTDDVGKGIPVSVIAKNKNLIVVCGKTNDLAAILLEDIPDKVLMTGLVLNVHFSSLCDLTAVFGGLITDGDFIVREDRSILPKNIFNAFLGKADILFDLLEARLDLLFVLLTEALFALFLF